MGSISPTAPYTKSYSNMVLVEENMKKKEQRKVRYEREHSMSLWQETGK